MVKRINYWVGCVSVVFALSCFSAPMPAPASTVQSLDSVVAVVNDSVVTQSQLHVAMRRARSRMRAAHMVVPPQANLKKSVLQQLIDRELQLQLAQRAGMKVGDKQVKAFMSKMAQRQHLSLAQWKKNMWTHGYNEKSLKSALRDQLLINQIQAEAVVKNIKVGPQQLKEVSSQLSRFQQQATQYRIVDYTVTLPDTPSKTSVKAAQRKAARLVTLLKQGRDQSGVAGVEKNEMGWVRGNQIPDLFLKAVQGQSSGFISQPLQAANGFHVLKLEGQQGAANGALSSQQLRAYAMQHQFVKGLSKWLKTLRKSAYVKVMPS